jgi:hypothetical protein
MSWLRLLRPRSRDGRRGRAKSRRARPELRSLESRMVLYAATGNAWMNPAVVTISFMPDGTELGGAQSNIFASFNGNPYLAGRWQNEILRAAQVWAQQTNLNFVVVPDDGAPLGEGAYQQGSPNHGDIRIGGHNFGNTALAEAAQPPPINNYSGAGDIIFNTGMNFKVGTTYDLFTVASHEIGHALGLDHTGLGPSVMYPLYNGMKPGLNADDIAGIRSIYSGGAMRSKDRFDALGLGNTVATAVSLTETLDLPTQSSLITDLDISSAGDVDNFLFVPPLLSSGTMKLTVQSQGLSLLAPKVTVKNSLGVVLASASGAGQYGTTLTVNVPNVLPALPLYVTVQGADNSAFGTGRYAIGVSFNGSTPPTQSSPIVPFLNGEIFSAGGGQPDMEEYAGAIPIVTGIGPDTGISDADGITGARRVSVMGYAPSGMTVTVYCDGQRIGTTIADAKDNWTFDYTNTDLSDGAHQFTAAANYTDGSLSQVSYAYRVVVSTHAPSIPKIDGIASTIAKIDPFVVTAARRPTFFGEASPSAIVTLASGSRVLGTTVADRNGNWNLTLGVDLDLGPVAITATASDAAGNVSDATKAYSLFVVPPVGIAPGAVDQVVSQASVLEKNIKSVEGDLLKIDADSTFKGKAKAGTLVAILEDGVLIGVTSVDLFGQWSVKGKLSKGVHTISFQVFDINGNHGVASGALNVLVS